VVADPGITISRVFDAPRERVWEEWTEVERFSDWFGGSEAKIPLDSVSMDVRAGGAWRLTMFAPQEIRWHGEYVEVDAPARLVFSISDEPEGGRYEYVTVELEDLGDGRTQMHFEQSGELPPETYEAAKRGWGRFFDRLDERLLSA
jgi:uncharacterized protein YndB with AHSA1/START domain